MLKDYSNKNLQKARFNNEDLAYARFDNSNLRGADFSGADLSGADFTHAKTGITVANAALIFILALIISLCSGYVAMLAGTTVQGMLASRDELIKVAGYVTLFITVFLIVYTYLKGGHQAARYLLIPVIALSAMIGIVAYLSGAGTGLGMLNLVIAILLIMVMFVIGAIARVAAGSLSNILFIIVALSGGMFGKSVGGGIGTVIMALSCAVLSKRALSGAPGFERLRAVACFITKRFGTSFRNTKLDNANFADAGIRNCDFSDADISHVQWGKTRKKNCIDHDMVMNDKKDQS